MEATEDECLFRALGPDGVFLKRRRKSSDMGLWLREILIQYGGYSAADVKDISSHSLKDTYLSWCTKAGVKHGIRRLLGGHAKANDLVVNPSKKKQLSNMRSSGSDDTIKLTPPKRFTLEEALEFIEDDELVEVTPNHIRIRKTELDHSKRRRKAKDA